MKKIVFIEPKASNLHIYSRFKLPRLGLYILGTLMKNRGWDVEVICEETRTVDYSRLKEADLIGVSTITATAPRAYLIADRIRKMGIPLIMGGPHVSFMADEALQHADFVIRGEGERALMALIDAWEDGRDYSGVPNLSYREGDEIRHNPRGAGVADLDQIPFPDLEGLNFKPRALGGGVTIPVQTSRGCPYDCSFCSVTGMFGRRYRFRSTASIIEELRRYNRPKTHIFFYDDNFAADRRHLRELLTAMIREEFCFSWSTQVRADIARDEDLVALMRQAGCSVLYIGLESVNPRSLEASCKRQTVPEIVEAVRIIRNHHIRIHGMFVYGFDEDDWSTVRKTVRFAKRAGLASTQFLILTPLPGSRVYRQMNTENRLLFRDWSLYDAHHVVFQPKRFSLLALQRAQLFSHREFYSGLRALKAFLQGKWIELGLAAYARRLNHLWEKRNQAFMKAIELLTCRSARIQVDYRQNIHLE
jgi:radical SAM superfamily enzyme YgiQ (UPF0313 family)